MTLFKIKKLYDRHDSIYGPQMNIFLIITKNNFYAFYAFMLFGFIIPIGVLYQQNVNSEWLFRLQQCKF